MGDVVLFLQMEVEEDLEAASASSSREDGVPAGRSTIALGQYRALEEAEQQGQEGMNAVFRPLKATYSPAASVPADASSAVLSDIRPLRLPGVVVDSSSRESDAFRPAAAPLPIGGPPDATSAVAYGAASICNDAAPRTADVVADNAAHVAARQSSDREPSDSVPPVTLGEDWWLPQAGGDEWSEFEERAGVVSRVLQVLQCDSLLREARKALHAARAEMMDVEVDVCAADIKRSLRIGQEDARLGTTAAPAGHGGISPRGAAPRSKTGNTTPGGIEGVEVAAAGVNQQAHAFSEAEVAKKNIGGASGKAQAAVVKPSREVTLFVQTASSTERREVTGASLSVPDIKTSFEAQHLRTSEPTSIGAAGSSTCKANWQTDAKAVCSGKEETRRTVWMRGERSESDLQDDSKVRALRALIPEILATIPEWLDAKLDTGRRGEWLGFQKILPEILRQRYGFTGNDLRKEGPFCWKGSRQTSVMEANTLLLSSAEAQRLHAGLCCSKQLGGEDANSFYMPQENQQEENQQQLRNGEAQAQQQFQLQVLQPEKELQQPPRQQTTGAGLVFVDERLKETTTENCSHNQQQFQEHFHASEAMDVDEESDGLHLTGKSSYCVGISDEKSNPQAGSSSSNAQDARRFGNAFSENQGSQPLRELHSTVQPRDGTAVALEVTSIWVNGFQESGKPYDVQIQASIDGRLARVFYMEIKATVAAHPCFILSLPQLEFARVQGPDNYLVLVICSIREASPAWMVLDNVAERVDRSLRSPLSSTLDSQSCKIRCRFDKQLSTSHLAAQGHLTEQSIDDILGCLLKPCH